MRETCVEKLMKKLKTSIFHSNTIFIQLVVFTVVVSIVPIIIISGILFGKMSRLVENTLNKSYSQSVAQYMTDMNENFFRYRDSLQQIANNTIIIDELLNRGSDKNPYIKGEKVSVEVRKSLRLDGYNEFRYCMVYSNREDAKIYGNKVSMIEEATRELWYTDNSSLEEGAFSYIATDGKSRVLSLIEDIKYINTNSFKQEDLGIVKLDLDLTKLFAPIKSLSEESYPYNIIVLDQENQLVYASEESMVEVLQDIPFEALSNKDRIIHNNIMIYGDTIDAYDLKVVFLFESDIFTERKIELKKSITSMVLIVIGVIAITAYFFTRSFSKRVTCLVNKIKLVEAGNFTVTEEISGSDEIAILDKQFNSMLKRLKDLIQKNYIQQLEKKEAELRNLQLQINPHFLYNTLETISSMAAIKHEFNICDLCEKLGAIFRYSLGRNYGEYVSIDQELKHTQNYIFIQKARFGNKFKVKYDVEEELMHHQILRFILQPIVENAIIHGLSMCAGTGNLEVSIKKENDSILIRIQDDGVGMTSERLTSLIDYIDNFKTTLSNGSKSIGVKNVNERIKLSCGSDYGITIQSELNQGSCFIITLPLMQ